MPTWSSQYADYVTTTSHTTGYYRPIQFKSSVATKKYTAVEKLSIRVETICRRARML